MMKVKYFKHELKSIEKLYEDSNSKDLRGKFKHCLKVTFRAMEICKLVELPYTPAIELACLLHDVGLRDGRKGHHLNGVKYLKSFIKDNGISLNDDDYYSVIMAINQHRKGYKPPLDGFFPLISQIVSAADTELMDKPEEEAYNVITDKLIGYLLEDNKDIHTVYKEVYAFLKKLYGKDGVVYNNPLIKLYKEETFSKLIEDKLKSDLKSKVKKAFKERK